MIKGSGYSTKILLVNPSYSIKERYGAIASFGPANEPLGLVYVDSSFERNKYDVIIFDVAGADLCTDDISRKVRNESYNIVGIAMITPT